jgi:hypothetical protein
MTDGQPPDEVPPDDAPDEVSPDAPSPAEEAARRLDPLKAAREAAERAAATGKSAEPSPPPKRIEADRAQPSEAAPTPEPYDLRKRLGPTSRTVTPVVDVRKYQRRLAMFGIAALVLISIVLFAVHGTHAPGIARGETLHKFVAPLATSGITLPANANPHCNPAKPEPHGLNMCNRRPIVLAFFVTGDGDCVKEVDALQRISSQFPTIEFAALAVQGDIHDTLALVRSHHWTIPVGTDPDGRVGQVYGVEFCPIVEIAQKGGVVAQRLTGDAWSNPAKLATEVRKYLG